MVAEGIVVLCGLSRFDSDNLLDNDDSIDVAVYFDHSRWETRLSAMSSNHALEEIERVLSEAGFEVVRVLTGPWFTKSKILNATVEQIRLALEEAQGIRIVTGQTIK